MAIRCQTNASPIALLDGQFGWPERYFSSSDDHPPGQDPHTRDHTRSHEITLEMVAGMTRNGAFGEHNRLGEGCETMLRGVLPGDSCCSRAHHGSWPEALLRTMR